MRTLLAALLVSILALTPALADPHWGHGGGGWGGGWHGGGGWGWHGGNPLGNFGAGIVGGVIGGWLSRPDPAPVIVQQPPVYVQPAPVPDATAPWSPAWYDYCAKRFHTFDAHTGYYFGIDGQPHFCQ